MSTYSVIRAGGNVKRFHTVQIIGEQTVAAHSFNVAMLCKTIKPDCSADLILAALLHDVPECETGDIPATAKWANPDLEKELRRVERSFERLHGFNIELTREEEEVLKIADMIELVYFCVEQRRLGNTSIYPILDRGVRYLRTKDMNIVAQGLLNGLLEGSKCSWYTT